MWNKVLLALLCVSLISCANVEIKRLKVKYAQVSYSSEIEDKVNAVIQCESGGVHDRWGDLDYPYHAYGIAQFQERTFYWMEGLAKPDHKLYWYNEQDQRFLLKWAIENGLGKYWTCYRRLYEEDSGSRLPPM